MFASLLTNAPLLLTCPRYSLCKSLTSTNPAKRPSAAQSLSHPFFAEIFAVEQRPKRRECCVCNDDDDDENCK